MVLNLEKQLVFYGAYHHNRVNIAIHMTCVPIILITAIQLATNSPILISLPGYLQIKDLPPNLGTIIAFVYGSGYILLEPVAGSILAFLLIAGATFMNHLTRTYGQTATYWAAGLQVVSWMAQFIGHGAFEKRAPALLDNLVQALFLAPLFVWMEFLFFLGYRSELKNRMNQGVEREISQSRGKGSAK